MSKSAYLVAAALLLALTGCSGNAATAEAPRPPADTPVAFPSPPPVPSPTAAPVPAELVVTLYGTDATFIFSPDGSTIQQLEHQTGPFSFTMPYAGKPVFVNASAGYGGTPDVGCKVTLGETVLMDKTAENQIAAMCQGSVG